MRRSRPIQTHFTPARIGSQRSRSANSMVWRRPDELRAYCRRSAAPAMLPSLPRPPAFSRRPPLALNERARLTLAGGPIRAPRVRNSPPLAAIRPRPLGAAVRCVTKCGCRKRYNEFPRSVNALLPRRAPSDRLGRAGRARRGPRGGGYGQKVDLRAHPPEVDWPEVD